LTSRSLGSRDSEVIAALAKWFGKLGYLTLPDFTHSLSTFIGDTMTAHTRRNGHRLAHTQGHCSKVFVFWVN
jgi:hypothetical protein